MEGVEEFNYESHIGLVEIYYTAFVKRRMEKTNFMFCAKYVTETVYNETV